MRGKGRSKQLVSVWGAGELVHGRRRMRSQQARLAAGRDFSVGKELGYGLVGAHGGQALSLHVAGPSKTWAWLACWPVSWANLFVVFWPAEKGLHNGPEDGPSLGLGPNTTIIPKVKINK